MSDVSPDPPRLREQLGSDIRTDLVKKAMPPSLGAAKKAELFTRLMAALPATSGERPAVSPPGRSTMKLVVAAAIPIAIGALALVTRGRTSEPPISSAAEPPSQVVPEPTTKPSPEVRVDDLPSATPAVAHSAASAVGADPAPARRKLELSGPGPRAGSSPDTLGEELRLLDLARGSLSGDPTKALHNANEHARRFPTGQLAAERELVAVEALVRLGRMTEARARAASLRRVSPALDDRVSQILGERKAP